MNRKQPGTEAVEAVDRVGIDSARGRADRLIALLIAIAALVPFIPALGNDFVNWDDGLYLTGHDRYRGLGWEQIRWMFTTTHGGPYQPLAWLSWGLDHELWGMNPRGYHLTNMLLHAAGAGVLYLVALVLLRRATGPGESEPTEAVRAGACLAALFFAVHPLRVESVAWATERRDVLSGLFYLLSVLAYLRWYERRAGGDRGAPSWPGGAFALCIGALLSKGMSVSLPVVLLVLDVYPLRRFGLRFAPGRPWFAGELRRAVLEKVPFLLASLVIGLAAIHGVRQVGAFSEIDLPVTARLAITGFGACFYLLKTVWPTDLSPLYEFPIGFRAWHWPYLVSMAAFVTICVAVYRWRHRCPAVAAAWVCYLIVLAPVSGLLHAGPQIAADRYTYLATISFAVLLGGCFGRIWSAGAWKKLHAPLAGCAALVVAALGLLTYQQTLLWRCSLDLWGQALRVDPDSWNARHNLGISLAELNRPEEAIERYRQALEINPDCAKAHYNLGNALRQQGELIEAVEHYRRSLQLNPTHAEAQYNLGVALAQQGHAAEAEQRFEEAVRLKPDYAFARFNLGTAYLNSGRLAEAVLHLSEAVRLSPGWAPARLNLGHALAGQGKLDRAAEEYRRALQIDPQLSGGREALEAVRTRRPGANTP